MEPEVELNSPANPLAQRKARREAVAEQAAEVTSAELEEEKAYQEAREAELGKTLTLEDINGSYTLQKLGVLSGDRVKDGKLIRIHSRDEDVIDIDHVLTQEDIDNSATLQRKDAEVGDLIINKDGKREFLSRGSRNSRRQDSSF